MESRNFLGPGGLSADEARDLLRKAVDVGLTFKYRQNFANQPDPAALDAIATEQLPADGQPLDDLLDSMESDYLKHMPNFAAPSFAGFPDAGNSAAGTAGAVLAELVNVNMINAAFCSRGATEMEIALIRWLRQLIGYSVDEAAPASAFDVGGIPTGGGTMANFAAVLLARGRAIPNVREQGLQSASGKLRVLLPEHIGHYTIGASLAWSGLGLDSVLYAPVSDYRYDLTALHQVLAGARDRGEQVIMAVAYAGDSRTMTIDNLTAIAEIVRSHFPRAWLHCDGCHGTSLLFSEAQRGRLDGLTEFDSVMMDPHKVLAVPYTNSFVLLRDPAEAAVISTESELILRQARSLGQITPATGSRAFQSLRTWMLIKAMGVSGIGEMIDRRIDNARKFAEIIDETPGLVRLNDVSINSVMFTLDPSMRGAPFDEDNAQRSSAVTENVYQEILKDGFAYLHSFRIADTGNRLGLGRAHVHPALRFMSGNALLRVEDMHEIVQHCLNLGKRVEVLA
ncbi:pyridoxal phosphate-dependent decarboxylase family protein [Actinophytocola sp.]|uniref:pyridoxal phosphate-dependent decarboxylase family protein n=1 Tax=Actinophytocola sp. TaxID=1872138 RepID=UPI002D5279F6|nr:pyridoxal-dependent decarboxylase [Actinophytocola sp.]HYQ69890.1 pyridoxal-dependent decarboxylase [Actinophytocola sp.]